MKDVLSNIKLNQEINTKTLTAIGGILVFFLVLIITYDFIFIRSLHNFLLHENLENIANKTRLYLIEDKLILFSIITAVLSVSSLILGLISVIRLQKLGWLIITISLFCLILEIIT